MEFVLLGCGGLLSFGLPLLWYRRRYLITTIDGPSMEPTLRSGDRLLVRRTKRIQSGQITVFTFPEGDRLLIKRAVAVPGELVSREWGGPGLAGMSGMTVPPDSLVVLGDNRATSWDSRHYGLVHRNRVVGVAVRHLIR